MSNILIIKHGSLGDIAQISGVIQDIKENFKEDEIYILTTPPFVELFTRCPYLSGVLLDRRLPRWNIIYLLKLKRNIKRHNFKKIFDLQNSSRTSFYRKFLLKNISWSSTDTTLDPGMKKSDYDQDSVLNRFDIQLKKTGLNTKHTLSPDFSWAAEDINEIINKYTGKKFILLFPFCSKTLSHKKWPHFYQLIKDLKVVFSNYDILVAPGKDEIEDSKKMDVITVLNKNKSLNISELSGLIKRASFVVANDTGPAHIAAHLKVNGVALFGPHTTPFKVSIETEKFKTITKSNLQDISSKEVINYIKNFLD